ncbi:MAG: SOS response-associated peptidase [Leptolyngbyaceae cyanobacterium RU_5_1]|nr:SOS response-associated peptidase [Leptolyngbyaceae cyanobacterium RU_5_1]
MCGRFTQTHSTEAIATAFQLAVVPLLTPRYNIAPTQFIATVLKTAQQPERHFKVLQWGLIPSWAKDSSIGAKLINARSETVTEKPSFRAAFRYRRCLVVADGFYEWQRQERKKQPFYFHLQDHQPFAFAGLWEHWQSPEGEPLETCTILTTAANDVLTPVHDRMPVILHPENYDTWLDPELQTASILQPLLRPYPEAEMIAYPVDSAVNRASCDRPECIQPLNSQ